MKKRIQETGNRRHEGGILARFAAVLVLAFLAIFLFLPSGGDTGRHGVMGVFLPGGRAFAAEEAWKACSARMGEIATLLELWRVDHGAYPTAKEFTSPEFRNYGKLGQNPVEFVCPESGKPYLYRPAPTRDNYLLSCPEPGVHGLPRLERTCSEQIQGETELSHEDRLAMKGAIETLYRAYAARDLEKVLEIERIPIDNSAKLLHEKKGVDPAEVREAFQSMTQAIFKAPGFKMKPLNLKRISFKRRGEICEVASFSPILESNRVDIGIPGEPMKVNVRISQFVFKKATEGWELIKMDL